MRPFSRFHVARPALLLAAAISLAGCASTPFKGPVAQHIDRAVTPAQALAAPDAARGKTVIWGGKIIASQNLSNASTLTVLAYPLDRQGEPDTRRTALGRFIATRPGYLETMNYAPGRLVTVLGTVTGVRPGQVGEAPYRYPVLQAEQMHLWPRAARYRYPPFQFGIGVGVGL